MAVHRPFRFDVFNDLTHGTHGVHRVLSDAGLAAEHDRVRPVQDGVGHVVDLRPCGGGRFNHALEHLRGHDDGLALGHALADNVFLQQRHLLHGHLHAQIPPGHHHGVGRFEDGVEVFDGLGLLDFGHNAGVLACRVDLVTEFVDVRRLTHKREPNPIHVFRQGEFQVSLVLGRDAGQRHLGFRKVQPFAWTQRSTVDHLALHLVLAVGLRHPQGELAVVHEHAFPRLHIGCEGLVVGVHNPVASHFLSDANHQGFPLHKRHFTSFDVSDPQLGALQIGQHRSVRPELLVQTTHGVDGGAVHLVGSVRKVDSGHVQAFVNQRPQDVFRGRGGAECGHNFGALGFGCRLRHKVRA